MLHANNGGQRRRMDAIVAVMQLDEPQWSSILRPRRNCSDMGCRILLFALQLQSDVLTIISTTTKVLFYREVTRALDGYSRGRLVEIFNKSRCWAISIPFVNKKYSFVSLYYVPLVPHISKEK